MSGPLDILEWRPESQARPDAPQADTRRSSDGETIAAAFRVGLADHTGRAANDRVNAYLPLLEAMEELGHRKAGYMIATGGPTPFAVNERKLWSDIGRLSSEQRTRLGVADQASFDKGWQEENRARVMRDQGVADRGGTVARLLGGFGAGAIDGVNLTTIGVGGSVTGGIARKVITEGLAQVGVELFQQPLINVEREAQGRPAMTLEERATGAAIAFGFGATVRGGIEIAPKVDAAGVRALAPVRQAVDRVFSDRDMARAFARSVPAHLRTPDEAAALHVALRGFEVDDASPFQRTYAGIDANAAKLAEAMDAIEAGRVGDPTASLREGGTAVERSGASAATLTPSRPVSRASGAPARSGGKLHGGIVSYLRQAGLPAHLARGIAAGIEAESRSSHSIVNPTSGAFGIGQWLGPRKKALFDRYGRNPSMQQQLEFLVWELRGGDHGGKSVLGAGNEAEALRRYIVDFMRPAAGSETTGDLARGMAALGRGSEDLPVGGANTVDVASAGDDALDDALAAEAADVAARQAALEEPLTPQGPQLRRDGFGSDTAWRIAQAEADADFLGTNPADDLLYRLRQVVDDRAGKRSLNRADELAVELGTTPAALREGLDRLAELGEITRRKDGRYGRLATGGGRSDRTLLEWIGDRGGMTDTGGELAHMGADRWHRGAVGRAKLIRPAREKGGMFAGGYDENSAEALFEAAISDGFFPEFAGRLDQAGDADLAAAKPDIATFYAAIERELGGDPVRSVHYDRAEARAAQRGVRRKGDLFQSDEHYEYERGRYDAAAERLFGRKLDEDEFLDAFENSSALPERGLWDEAEWEAGVPVEADLVEMANRRLAEALDDAWLEAEKDVYDLQAWELDNAARREGEAGRDGGDGSGAVEGDAGEGGAGGRARPGSAQDAELGAASDAADAFGLRGDPVPNEAAARAFDDDAGDGARMAAESAWHDILARPETVRLYRGEAVAGDPSVGDMPASERGLWFTKDPKVAEVYAGEWGGRVYHVDIPIEQLDAASTKFRAMSNGEEYMLTPEWAARKVGATEARAAADTETYDLDDGLGPRTAGDVRADLDAERAALDAMRSCLK